MQPTNSKATNGNILSLLCVLIKQKYLCTLYTDYSSSFLITIAPWYRSSWWEYLTKHLLTKIGLSIKIQLIIFRVGVFTWMVHLLKYVIHQYHVESHIVCLDKNWDSIWDGTYRNIINKYVYKYLNSKI